ncbi:TPA: hypothetical protein I9Y43_004038 [Kluyvera ascorbata]|nr:hypothetical protein [Kluyvera ascorbata]
MSNYAVVENGIVINVVVWDGQSEWNPDVGEAIPATDGVGIGWTYSNGVFEAPYDPNHDDENQEQEVDSEVE